MNSTPTTLRLQDGTVEFIGHALALNVDDAYLDRPALKMVKAVKLYEESLARFNTGSPYIYPLYGLGELPQGFARLSAVYGGTYMLAKPDVEVTYDPETKRATGVTSEGESARAKFVVGDPSYFPGKTRRIGRVVRAICILSHPIPNCGDAHSVQIILPQAQTGRQSDMYVFGCSWAHNVCAKGKYLAFVSTTVETANPHLEIEPGLALLGASPFVLFVRTGPHTTAVRRGERHSLRTSSPGVVFLSAQRLGFNTRPLDAFQLQQLTPFNSAPTSPRAELNSGHIDEKFINVTDVMTPIADGKEDGCFISAGYDATTHFESTVLDVLDMYTRITGKTLDLSEKDPAAAAAER